MACAAWKKRFARLFGAFGSDFRRQPKVALSLCDEDIGVGEDAFFRPAW